MHGSSTSRARARAAERVTTGKALHALQRQGVEPVDNPLQVLQELAAEVVSLKDYMRDRIEQGSVGGEHLAAYERALDRAGRLLTDLSRLDLDERLARITKTQGDLIADVLLGTLRDLDLTAVDYERGRVILVRRLEHARTGVGKPATRPVVIDATAEAPTG